MGQLDAARDLPHWSGLKSLLNESEEAKNAFLEIFKELSCAQTSCHEWDDVSLLGEIGSSDSCYDYLAAIDVFFCVNKAASETHFRVGVAVVLLLADVLLQQVLPRGQEPASLVVVEGGELLDAALVAAQKVRFGLSFRVGTSDPDNVFFCDYLPLDEFGHEQGAAKLRGELWAKFYRQEVPSSMSEGRFKASISKFAKTVNGLVVALDVAYKFDCKNVDVVLGELGVALFLWQKKENEAAVVRALGDLKSALGLIFGCEQWKSFKGMGMSEKNTSGSVVNNVTVNMHGGTLAQGGVQVAGSIDNKFGISSDRILSEVAVSLNFLREELKQLGSSEHVKDILDDLNEVEKSTASGKVAKEDVKFVERSLKGMESTAKLLDAGGKVVEGVQKLSAALKPVLAAVVSASVGG